MNTTGAPIPFDAQDYDMLGDYIIINTTLDTYHMGHMEIYACDDVLNLNQTCFNANPLTFMEDLSPSYLANEDFPALADPVYEERAYYSPVASAGGAAANRHYSFAYKLPVGMSGDVILQYRYRTANSCNPEGAWENYTKWWEPNLSNCTGIPTDGDQKKSCGCQRGKDAPPCACGETFWNCVEINIAAVP